MFNNTDYDWNVPFPVGIWTVPEVGYYGFANWVPPSDRHTVSKVQNTGLECTSMGFISVFIFLFCSKCLELSTICVGLGKSICSMSCAILKPLGIILLPALEGPAGIGLHA